MWTLLEVPNRVPLIPEALQAKVRNLGFVEVSSRFLRNYSSELAEIWYADYVGSQESSSYCIGKTPGQGQKFGIRVGIFQVSKELFIRIC